LHESGQKQTFYRLLNDFDCYICKAISCSKETRLLLQAILNEGNLFKRWGMDFLQILGPTEGPWYRGFVPHLCTGFQYRDTIATILSGPDRAPDYPVDGGVYASLAFKMAGFLVEL
jgi:hypothetical protein